MREQAGMTKQIRGTFIRAFLSAAAPDGPRRESNQSIDYSSITYTLLDFMAEVNARNSNTFPFSRFLLSDLYRRDTLRS